tara:strand:+ start:710 stop:1321 length:612 start_codon:yes stop_codon:yes gene_type:complete
MTTKTPKTTTKKTRGRPKSVKVAPVSLDLPRNPFSFEVLDLVSKQKTAAKKVEVLKRYEHPSLKALFIWNFDSTVISVLPQGEVPYTGYDEQTSYSGTLSTKITEEVRRMHETGSFSMGTSDKEGHTTIRREFKNFYHFIKGGNDSINSIRRETMFINILEGLHPLEAEIVVLVKDKRLQDVYKVTQDVVATAYPDITWGNRS